MGFFFSVSRSSDRPDRQRCAHREFDRLDGARGLGSRARPLRIEALEQRGLLDATAVFGHVVYGPAGCGVTPAYNSPPSPHFTPPKSKRPTALARSGFGG